MAEDACASHPRRPALTVCVACGRAVCRECLVTTRVGVKCPDCSSTAGARSAGRRRLSRRRAGIGAGLAAVVLLGALGLLALRGDEQPRTVSSSGADGPTAENVAFAGADGFTLRGTLDLPRDVGSQERPGVVIVPGFGPTVREGVRQAGGRIDDLYTDLGDTLARHGFVVLRYDKRGTGESTPLPEGSELVFDQHVEDAAGAVEFLAGRPEVDASRVAVVGHDQGGLVGMRLAGDDSADVAALALVATAGRPLADAVADEIRNGDFVAEDRADELADEFTRAVEELRATGEVPEVSEPLQPVLPAESAAFLQSVFFVDPAELARRVDVPVLIARGGRDPGIREEDVETLRAALTRAPAVEVLRVPEAGSTLAHVPESDDGEQSSSDGAAGGSSAGDGEHGGNGSSSGMHDHPGGAQPANSRDEDALRRLAEWLASALHG